MKFRKFFRRENSLNNVLSKLAGRKAFERITAINNDWRNLPEESAQQIQAPLIELMQNIAEYFQVPYISRVPSIDIDLLPQGISIIDLKRLACIPRIGNNGITAYICLDPKRAKLLFPKKDMPMAIASWASIQSALNESEAAYRTKYKDMEETKIMQALEAAKQALHLVISQVKAFSVENLEISFNEDNKIIYSFLTKEGKRAEGDINVRVRDGLYELLSEFSTQASSTLQLSDLARHFIKVNFDEIRGIFSLNLQSKVIPFPESEAPRHFEVKTAHDGKPRQVLIVDDNHIFAKVLEKFLAKLNISATFAKNGKEAINIINNSEARPDLVICDLHMPEMNGFEFLKRVRGELELPDLPVIILTSDNDVETHLQLLTDGADAFIAKSEDPRLLCVKIEKLLEKAGRRKAA